ncbi:MAG: ATP-binding protein, partial [Eubacteriales bacterium]|nr:ATP-binding protein [Eubacteriales bacterium]
MMRELADNILDIAQNSISAGASLVEIDITVSREKGTIEFVFKDDGCGMSEEMVRTVTDPFTTTRKTRKVGLGLPLLKQTALMTGGDFDIASKVGEGTCVRVSFGLENIDRPPMGDVPGTLFTLAVMNLQTDFLFVL